MSYSGWTDSKWFTFRDSSGLNIASQGLVIIKEDGKKPFRFSYRDLKNDLDTCLSMCEGDEELVKYMSEFISDVENYYSKTIQ